MTAIAARPSRAPGGVRLGSLADRALWLVVFSGGFVLWEPAPYELMLAGLMPLFLLAGLPIRGSVAPLLATLLLFSAGGFLSVTLVSEDLLRDGVLYMAVSLFLCLSAVWFAAIVAEDWRRIRVVERACVAAGVVVAAIGIAAYFRLAPGLDDFLLYGRARGTFKDPNVFGPFLVLPALILARRLMTGPILTRPGTVLGLAILVLGVFLSFSRAGWALLALTLVLLAMVVAATAPSNRARLRLAGLVLLGFASLSLLIAVAASHPAVQDLLMQRAKLMQEYDAADGAALGRFARHWVGFQMATGLPLGVGPFEFPRLFVEATHNVYLKALMEYGWLGFVAYIAAVAMTVRRAVPLLFRPRPWQPFAQCVVVAFLVHLAVGWVIDTDHWRHFFMMTGLIWGLAAADRPAVPKPVPGREP